MNASRNQQLELEMPLSILNHVRLKYPSRKPVRESDTRRVQLSFCGLDGRGPWNSSLEHGCYGDGLQAAWAELSGGIKGGPPLDPARAPATNFPSRPARGGALRPRPRAAHVGARRRARLREPSPGNLVLIARAGAAVNRPSGSPSRPGSAPLPWPGFPPPPSRSALGA